MRDTGGSILQKSCVPLHDNGSLAQLVEHRPVTAEVAGSNPVRAATTYSPIVYRSRILLFHSREAGSIPAGATINITMLDRLTAGHRTLNPAIMVRIHV